MSNGIKYKSSNEKEEKEQEIDEEKENEWLQPKNCTSMKHMHETCGKKESDDNNSNNHVELSDNEEKKRMKNLVRH